MTVDSMAPQTRRRLLTLVTGGAVGALAAALGRASPVRAEGETMHVGGDHFTATSATQLKNTATDNDIFIATSTLAGRGVYGKSTGNHGVEGRSAAQGRAGVRGVTSHPNGFAMLALHEGNGLEAELAGGVAGVRGTAIDSYGVIGGSGYVGVLGSTSSTGAAGVMAQARGAGAIGRALDVYGRARFSLSGIATIAAGSNKVTVDGLGGGAIVAGTMAFATLQQYRADTHVAAAIVNVAQSKIVIRLNKTISTDTDVAWLLLEA